MTAIMCVMEKFPQKISQPVVEMNSTVWVKFESGAPVSFTIVPSSRTDPSRGIISCDSPMGKALLGKKQGDHITYTVGTHFFQADIIEIIGPTKTE